MALNCFFFSKRDGNIAIIVSGNQNVSTQLKERLPLLRRQEKAGKEDIFTDDLNVKPSKPNRTFQLCQTYIAVPRLLASILILSQLPLPSHCLSRDGLKCQAVPSCYHASLSWRFLWELNCFCPLFGGAASPYHAKHHLTLVPFSLWISHRLCYYVIGIQ